MFFFLWGGVLHLIMQSGVGLQLLALSLKEGADGFEIKHAGILGLVPHIARTPINANAKLQ
jgi:hypothetical protein